MKKHLCTLTLSMQEGHIERSKERFADDHWQMLNKEMPLFNEHTWKNADVSEIRSHYG